MKVLAAIKRVELLLAGSLVAHDHGHVLRQSEDAHRLDHRLDAFVLGEQRLHDFVFRIDRGLHDVGEATLGPRFLGLLARARLGRLVLVLLPVLLLVVVLVLVALFALVLVGVARARLAAGGRQRQHNAQGTPHVCPAHPHLRCRWWLCKSGTS
jgi:hypothetical protein